MWYINVLVDSNAKFSLMKKGALINKEEFRRLYMVDRDSGSLSPRHGASSGCGWRNDFQYGR